MTSIPGPAPAPLDGDAVARVWTTNPDGTPSTGAGAQPELMDQLARRHTDPQRQPLAMGDS